MNDYVNNVQSIGFEALRSLNICKRYVEQGGFEVQAEELDSAIHKVAMVLLFVESKRFQPELQKVLTTPAK